MPSWVRQRGQRPQRPQRPQPLRALATSAASIALPLLTALAIGLAAPPARAQGTGPDGSPPKVLRFALRVAETGFDPARVSDLYSRMITPHIFEGLYTYDQLARPARMKPLTAAALPEVSDDYRTWTVRLRPGIFFADDPAFQGRPRELVAQDYVYAIKRFADPAVVSPSWSEIEELGLLGLAEYRTEVRKRGVPFDYDHPIEGLRALDRYTLQFRVKETRPRLMETFAQSDLYGAVAREVIDAYPGQSAAHPVGTGPFVLTQWRRSSRMVLERNPQYRPRFYDQEVQPAPEDADGQALVARLKGRRLPMIDRVEISVIEETQPRWLSFLNGEFNFIERVPEDFITQAMPNGKLAPNLAKQGMKAYRVTATDVMFTVFNMEDPVVGGYTPDKVALRRAIGLALDVNRELSVARRGQGYVAQSLYMPNTTGFDPAFKSENGDFDPARAKALLDLYGYVDKDGDGWRDQPDGRPLVLESLTTPEAFQRQIDEIYQKNLAAIGLRINFKTGKWPENLKAMRAGRFSIWSLATSGSKPDGQDSLGRLYSGQINGQNYARFTLPALDKLYQQVSHLPDGPERAAVFLETKRISAAYMPYKYRLHRYITDIARPEIIGYRRSPFWLNWWEYVDIAADGASPSATPPAGASPASVASSSALSR
ncbi:ABC-type transport system, substrate-binding protein [Roseateles sp. YR242]|uniref:ABC transporter substrate-binding protein n=1 Tax=Roseateles sp. YR242 TaxID=1855305 RepID=UPI0008D8C256|nr:ABC transporter substrate-binding protein [Roseateles sp. YR242]SEL77246.1 ABC-type transport system, substrate-binding protein [Roseateles sp. YR242]